MSDFSQPLVSAPFVGTLSTSGPSAVGFEFCAVRGSSWATTTSGWANANQAIYQGIMVPAPITVTHLMLEVVTQSGNVDVGIYTEGGTRLVSAGSTAVGSAGLQSFDITDTALSPGVYWLACSCSSTSAVFRSNVTIVTSANYFTGRARGFMVEASAVPLPATATFAAAGGALVAPILSAAFRTTF